MGERQKSAFVFVVFIWCFISTMLLLYYINRGEVVREVEVQYEVFPEEHILEFYDFHKPMDNFVVTSGFGFRADPFTGVEVSVHKGIDLKGPAGSLIYAVGAGTVVSAFTPRNPHPIYGCAILIHHGYGLYTFYAHLSRLYATIGQRVNKGATIGVQGSTGDSTGPHLHFEILVDPTIVNTW